MPTRFDDPAFPFATQTEDGCAFNPGLTKREYFAAIIFGAMLAGGNPPPSDVYPVIAKNAVEAANALIEALE